jgi:acyl-CoA synthetase (NDP forming)
MVEYTRNLEMLLEVPPKMTGHMVFDQEKARKLIAAAPAQEFLLEKDSKEILAAYGLPVIKTEIAETEAQASRIGREVGYPLVMTVHGIVLHENRNMLALGKKLGFEINRDSGDNELVIHLKGNRP